MDPHPQRPADLAIRPLRLLHLAPLAMVAVDWLVVSQRIDPFPVGPMLLFGLIGLALAWFPRRLADAMANYIGRTSIRSRITQASPGWLVRLMLRGLGWVFLLMPLLGRFDPR